MAAAHSTRRIPASISHYTPPTPRFRFTVSSRMDSSTTPDAGDAAGKSETPSTDGCGGARRVLIYTRPMGSGVTQGCHASVAAIWAHKDDPHRLEYCSLSNLDSKHKVTLEVKGETQLLNLSEKLTADVALLISFGLSSQRTFRHVLPQNHIPSP